MFQNRYKITPVGWPGSRPIVSRHRFDFSGNRFFWSIPCKILYSLTILYTVRVCTGFSCRHCRMKSVLSAGLVTVINYLYLKIL
jgi:hypothetical protein